MKVLNLGCGSDIRKSSTIKFVNLDRVKLPRVDIVHDIEKFPYPFKNNEFDAALCIMVLEHVKDVIGVMKELHRICKPGAIIKIKVPYFSCPSNYVDLTHKTLFSYYSFDMFTENSRYDYWEFSKMPEFKGIKFPMFKIRKRKLIFYYIFKPLEWIFNNKLMAFIYTGLFSYIFPAGEIYFELEVLK